MADEQEGAGPPWALAATALMLLVTSLLLPWWGIHYRVQGFEGSSRDAVSLFEAHPLVVHGLAIAAGVAVVAAIGVLFLRIAARSWRYEPRSWRRDLGIAAGLAVAAVGLTVLWPDRHPHFWGRIAYQDANGTGPVYLDIAQPFLGWWCALVAALLLVAASVMARRRKADMEAAPGTTSK